MDSEQIYEAQHPASAWRNAGREWPTGNDPAPRWADFADPLDAIGAKFTDGLSAQSTETHDGPNLSRAERRALKTLSLDETSDKKMIRRAYSDKLRLYHPDRNGGDRSLEKKLQAVVDAWQILRRSSHFDAG